MFIALSYSIYILLQNLRKNRLTDASIVHDFFSYGKDNFITVNL